MSRPSKKKTKSDPRLLEFTVHRGRLEFTVRRVLLGSCCLALGAFLGCSHPTKSGTAPGLTAPTIDKVNLLAAPVAFNLDGIPGGDTIAVKIYATNAREPKPVPITSGTLDLLAFDGLLSVSTNVPQPFKTWSFTASELRRLQFKASIGTGYQITASFIGLKPKSDRLTILARYLTESGRPIYSSPSTISLTAN